MTALADEYAPARCGATATLTHWHVGEHGQRTQVETSSIACTLKPGHKDLHADPALGWEWAQSTVAPQRAPKWRKDRVRRR